MKHTIWLPCILGLVFAGKLFAEEVRIAVASNFYLPMQAIAEEFEAVTGHEVIISPGSSGKLYAQIVSGAPFHVFFSADQEKPKALLLAGQGTPESLYNYAIGRLVLWSPVSDKDVEAMLLAGNYQKLALANPRLAPYGQAAVATLLALGLNDSGEQRKWVRGENIAQTWHFVSSGNTELGFVAMSQVIAYGSKGSSWVVPQEFYDPIRQDALLLMNGTENEAAIEFMAFIKSNQASAIIESFGYALNRDLSGLIE